MLDAFSVLIGLTAAFVWLNSRTWNISTSIATMLSGLVAASVIVILDRIGASGFASTVVAGIGSIDFGNTLMNVVLGVLLFVSALKLDANLLERQQMVVLCFSVVSRMGIRDSGEGVSASCWRRL